MHFQSESLRRDSGDEQWAILNSWWNMTMVLLLFVTPILMICSEESSESFELYIILTPITVAWFFLFIAYYMIRSQVKRYFTKVFRLMETNQAFKQNQTLKKMGQPIGRLTKHCKKYTIEDFQVRFLENFVIIMLSGYFGVFLKVYIFDLLLPRLAKTDESKLHDV